MLEQVYQYFVVFEITNLLLGYWKDVCSLSFSFENKFLSQKIFISWVYCCEFCLEIITKSSNVTLSTDLILHCWPFSCDKQLHVFVMQSIRSKPGECFSHKIFTCALFKPCSNQSYAQLKRNSIANKVRLLLYAMLLSNVSKEICFYVLKYS